MVAGSTAASGRHGLTESEFIQASNSDADRSRAWRVTLVVQARKVVDENGGPWRARVRSGAQRITVTAPRQQARAGTC